MNFDKIASRSRVRVPVGAFFSACGLAMGAWSGDRAPARSEATEWGPREPRRATSKATGVDPLSQLAGACPVKFILLLLVIIE